MNEIISLNDLIIAHCNESMEKALSAERYPLWKRACPEMNDIDFVRFGLMRCISAVNSGHHFLQTADNVYDEQIPLSTYFNSLKSPRRRQMVEAIEEQSYQLHSKTLEESGIDYLKQFPELKQYTVEAADGHFIDHAYHTKKSPNGKVYAAGFIYALNLRNGLLKALCCVTNGTKRNHETPALRDHIETQNNKKNKQGKHLYVYDKAVTDYTWWEGQKPHDNYMITEHNPSSERTPGCGPSDPLTNGDLRAQGGTVPGRRRRRHTHPCRRHRRAARRSAELPIEDSSRPGQGGHTRFDARPRRRISTRAAGE